MEQIPKITEKKIQKKFIVALISISLLAMLNMTTVTMALPTYIEEFKISLNAAQWVTIGYMLPLGMLMPLAGYLGERYSYRKVFLYGLIVMGVASVACACATNFYLLVLFRFFKGMAAGILIPNAMGMLYRYIPKQYQAPYLGELVLVQSVGIALGPTLSGFILQVSSWPLLFLINVPVVLLAYIIGRECIPVEEGTKNGSIDFFGIVQISLGTALVMIAFTEGDQWGWKSPLFLSVTAFGLFLMVTFFVRQLHTKNPLLNLKVLKYRPFTLALLIQCTFALTMGITAILLQLYFQTVRGYSPAETGLFVLIPSLGMMLGNEISNKLHGKAPIRVLLVFSMAITVIGNLAWCHLTVTSSIILLILFFTIRYTGMGMLQMPLTDYGLGCIPIELSGHASAMFNWSREFTTVIATNVLTVLMSFNLNRYYLEAGNTGIPTEGTLSYNIAASHAVGTDFVYMTFFLVLSLIVTFFIKPYGKEAWK